MKTRFVLAALAAGACFSPEPEGLAVAKPARTTVKVDLFHRPLPELPLPNDLATRHDRQSPTGRRINASMIAPTRMERRVRELIDTLDGWGTFQPISIPFTGPLDPQSVLAAHRDVHYGFEDDVIYLVNVDPRSPRFKKVHALDLGNGSYPVVLERRDNYWKNDPRTHTMSLIFEETAEDANSNGLLDLGEDANGNALLDAGEDLDGDGALDPPEDQDADGVLDVPNYLPGAAPAADDLAARADALMTFYDKETHTLLARPMEPLDERTTYAVIVTRRLKDAAGEPVGSPYKFVNHAAQTDALRPLLGAMPAGLQLDDVAFAFSFTTETTSAAFVAVRDGLYGSGAQKHLAAEFPAEITSLERLRDAARFPGMKKPTVLYAEQWAEAFDAINRDFIRKDPASRAFQALTDSQKYVDYFVIGSFKSPQLFQRFDAEGRWLGLDDQAWPPDLDRLPAVARAETVYFTLSVPRKEVSVRGEGKPAPIVLQGHGYGSNRFEGMQLAGYFAKHGFATLAIDGPSHGLGLSNIERSLVKAALAPYGLVGAGEALVKDRAYNQDHDPDGRLDSAADFWTAYLFHTRDVVRQYTLDWMQAVRILRTFDGARRWSLDVDGNGAPELAGDFDADGVVDIGAGSQLSMVGGSLGGIISMMVGSLEPEIHAITPIAGGGGFSDMGIRTVQGGAVEGFVLRAMAPLYVGTLESGSDLAVETIVNSLNSAATVRIATVRGVKPWDTMIVENLATGERGCGFVSAAGTVRTSVASDLGDRTRILIYPGPQLTGGECELRAGAPQPSRIVDAFEAAGSFEWKEDGAPSAWAAGAPLVALAEGLGLRRAHPDLRRFLSLGQLVLDAADPGTFARHLLADPLVYPGTGQKTGTHAVIVTTLGDLAVPASSGVTYGRAAGLIDYLQDDARFGKPMNQVLIEHRVAEAVHTLKRYTDPSGNGVHEDVENFSRGADYWGADIPRLATPLRIGWDKTDALGGVSSSIFPFPQPDGAHGFDLPGEMTDKFRSRAGCTATCRPGAPATDPCSCNAETFDIGIFMFNMLGRYLASGATALSDEACQAWDGCAWRKAFPPARSGAAIDVQ